MKSNLLRPSFASLTVTLTLALTCLVGSRLLAVETTHVTERDNGKTIAISQAHVLEVRLDGNPTTGFNWEVDKVDKIILKQMDQPTFQQDKDIIGSGGKVTFRWRAATPGKTTLRLVYRRPWEKGKPAAKTFEVKIEVR